MYMIPISYMQKMKSVSGSVVSGSLRPHGLQLTRLLCGILQARILEWDAITFSKGSSRPRDQIKSPALQVDSFLSEPPGKHIGRKWGLKLYSYLWFNVPSSWVPITGRPEGWFSIWLCRMLTPTFLNSNKHHESLCSRQVIIVFSRKMPVSLFLNEPCCSWFIDCSNLMPGSNLLLVPEEEKALEDQKRTEDSIHMA